MNNKLLVICPVWNKEQFIRNTIESILQQKYQDYHLVLIDDYSTDNSFEIMKEYQDNDKITLLRNEENKGCYYTRNRGLDHFKNDDWKYFTIHDADDISLRHRIERQLRVMSQTRTVHNLCGFYHCWSEEDVIRYAKIDENKDQDDEIKVIGPDTVNEMVMTGFQTPGVNHYSTGNFETAGVSAMFYKGIWQLGLRFNPPNKGLRTLVSEDSDFNFRVTAMLKNTSILAEQVYCYRRNTSTNSEEV